MGNDNFKLGYGWFSRAVNLVDYGARPAWSAGPRENVQYVDPTPQRKGRPDDIAFRSMPAHAQTRYAAGLEKMSMYGIQATFGEVAKNEWASALNEWVKFGEHVFMSHNDIREKDGSEHRDPVKLDDATNPERLKTLTDNQQYWTQRWADQMNYRYWKERCQAEQTDEAVRARELFYEGTLAYKTADFPKAAAKFKEGLQVWKLALNDHPVYRDDRCEEGDRADRHAVRAGAQAGRQAAARRHAVQGHAGARPERPHARPVRRDRDDRGARQHGDVAAGRRRAAALAGADDPGRCPATGCRSARLPEPDCRLSVASCQLKDRLCLAGN